MLLQPKTQTTADRRHTLAVHTSRVSGHTVDLHLVGELDLANTHVLGRVLTAHAAAGRPCIRVDLSRLAFIDTAGLNTLATVHHSLREAGGELLVINPPHTLARLATITGLAHDLRVLTLR